MSLGLKNLQRKCKLTDNQGKAEQVPSPQCVWKPVVLSERLSAQNRASAVYSMVEVTEVDGELTGV